MRAFIESEFPSYLAHHDKLNRLLERAERERAKIGSVEKLPGRCKGFYELGCQSCSAALFAAITLSD